MMAFGVLGLLFLSLSHFPSSAQAAGSTYERAEISAAVSCGGPTKDQQGVAHKKCEGCRVGSGIILPQKACDENLGHARSFSVERPSRDALAPSSISGKYFNPRAPPHVGLLRNST